MPAKARKHSQPSSDRRVATKPQSRRPKLASTRNLPEDAIGLLTADHAKVDAMFKKYESARSAQKESLVRAICLELRVHTQIEEEIFYPAVRDAAAKSDDAGDLLDEAQVEHDSAKAIIAELEAGSPGDQLFDAKVKVLAEYIRHHVKEEHQDIFPLARKRLDVKDLGQKLAERKAELLASTREEAALPRVESGILRIMRGATAAFRH